MEVIDLYGAFCSFWYPEVVRFCLVCPDGAIASGRVDVPSLAGAQVEGAPAGNGSGGVCWWIRLSKNGARCLGGSERRCDRLRRWVEAETQFARRLIIGFGLVKTNCRWRDCGGGMP